MIYVPTYIIRASGLTTTLILLCTIKHAYVHAFSWSGFIRNKYNKYTMLKRSPRFQLTWYKYIVLDQSSKLRMPYSSQSSISIMINQDYLIDHKFTHYFVFSFNGLFTRLSLFLMINFFMIIFF